MSRASVNSLRTSMCVSKLTIICSDIGLSRQAIIWTNAGKLLIQNLGTNFSEISSEINILSFKNMYMNMSSAKWRQFYICLNVLRHLTQKHNSIIFMRTKSAPWLLMPWLIWPPRYHNVKTTAWKKRVVYWNVYSGTDQRRHQSSASLAFVKGIHRWPVNSPHKGPVTRKMYPFDDIIMHSTSVVVYSSVYSGADQRKHQSSASLAFLRGIPRLPVSSPHKGSITRKMFPFDDIIMHSTSVVVYSSVYSGADQRKHQSSASLAFF